MDEAFQLALGLPALYGSLLLQPSGFLGMFAAAGMVCLLAGIGLASFRANKRAWLFLIPFVLSEAVVIGCGLLYSEISSSAWMVILVLFALATFWVVLRILAPIDDAPLELWLLALHSAAYAGLASFVASTFVSQATLSKIRLIAVQPVGQLVDRFDRRPDPGSALPEAGFTAIRD